MKNALIIGGTSGLGLDLAKRLKKDYKVIVIGRKFQKVENIDFIKLDISKYKPTVIDKFVADLPKIDLLCISAGFYQDGTITELSDDDIDTMINVGIRVPIMIVKKLLEKQKSLSVFVPVTSTSQWTPRLKEPIYTVVKGGTGMLANSLSLDPRIEKTLLVGPSGMKTDFWKDTDMDTTTFLDSDWVAEQIIDELEGKYSYKFIKILREPSRVEVEEERE